MLRIRAAVSLVTCLALVGVALAADDPIAQRRKLMQDNGRQESKANQLILGKYFPDKAVALLQKIEKNLTGFEALFPPGSETGGETHALPALWENKAEFDALVLTVIESAKAAEAAAPQGQEVFALAWQEVAEGCHGCHEKFAPLQF